MRWGWVLAGIVCLTCCGGILVAGAFGPDGVNSEEWRNTFHPADAGSAVDAGTP